MEHEWWIRIGRRRQERPREGHAGGAGAGPGGDTPANMIRWREFNGLVALYAAADRSQRGHETLRYGIVERVGDFGAKGRVSVYINVVWDVVTQAQGANPAWAYYYFPTMSAGSIGPAPMHLATDDPTLQAQRVAMETHRVSVQAEFAEFAVLRGGGGNPGTYPADFGLDADDPDLERHGSNTIIRLWDKEPLTSAFGIDSPFEFNSSVPAYQAVQGVVVPKIEFMWDNFWHTQAPFGNNPEILLIPPQRHVFGPNCFQQRGDRLSSEDAAFGGVGHRHGFRLVVKRRNAYLRGERDWCASYSVKPVALAGYWGGDHRYGFRLTQHSNVDNQHVVPKFEDGDEFGLSAAAATLHFEGPPSFVAQLTLKHSSLLFRHCSV